LEEGAEAAEEDEGLAFGRGGDEGGCAGMEVGEVEGLAAMTVVLPHWRGS